MNKTKGKHVFNGKRMAEVRELKGLTQTDLAKLIGGKQAQVATYETGDRYPNTDTLGKIAQALGCSADYLMGLADEPSAIYSGMNDDLRYILDMLQDSDVREVIQTILKLYKKK